MNRVRNHTQAILLAIAIAAGTAQPAPAQESGIWHPSADQRLALHWVLDHALDLNDPLQMGRRDFYGNVLPEPDIYDIDGEYNPKETVSQLHSSGKKVICYIDAGVYESYREDAPAFQALTPQIWGNKDANWKDSFWLDIRRINELAPIIKARMQMCKDKGFDAIEPDEIDGWENNSGFPLTYEDQLTYNKALASWAHQLGMSIGQKGDIIQTRDLVDDFDWTLNEECFQFRECTNPYDPILDKEFPGLQLYVQRNKAVFVAEYADYGDTRWSNICAKSATNRFNTTRFRTGLPNTGGRLPCSTSSGW